MGGLRTAGRVLSALFVLAMAGAAFTTIQLSHALPHPRSGYGSDPDDVQDQIRSACARSTDTGVRAFFARAQRAELGRTCAAIAGEPAADPSLPAYQVAEAVRRQGYRVSRAHQDVVVQCLHEVSFLLVVCGVLGLASLVAAVGLGKLGAGFAAIGLALVIAQPALAPVVAPAAIVVLATALASARWKADEGPPRPRAATAALVVSLLLVPLATFAVLGAGWAQDSYRLEKRLMFTAIVALVGWAFAGVPALVLAARARRALKEHPDLGGGARITVARIAVVVLGLATAVAIGHSFVPP